MALMRGLLLVIASICFCGAGRTSRLRRWASPALFLLKTAAEDAAQFALGNLGVSTAVVPSQIPVIAYRHLIGVGLNDKERAAIIVPPNRPATSCLERRPVQVSIPRGKPSLPTGR